MMLLNDQQLANTQEQLRHFERRYEQLKNQPGPLTRTRELSLRSLKRVIKQLSEDISRYNCRQPASPP